MKIQNQSLAEYEARSEGNVYLEKVLSVVPLKWGSEILPVQVNAVEASKSLFVGRENNMIFTRLFDAYTVIRERLGGVEVEDKKQARAFEHNDFVDLMLQGHVGLRRSEPAILLF